AKQDTLVILKSENVEQCGGILHCFTEDYDMAKKALDMVMYISFSGILTFKNAKYNQETAKKLPLDRMLIVTYAPYLTPVP
ncbi:TatD family hydrolase, partial [Francisella tularensis]|uniref:TatD family hydrolase n=1 Tax=Francisella tularensis TaxID=263 RepID=UPI002381C68B